MSTPELSPELAKEYKDRTAELKWLASDIKANLKRYEGRKWSPEQRDGEQKVARSRIRRTMKQFQGHMNRCEEIVGPEKWLPESVSFVEALNEMEGRIDTIYLNLYGGAEPGDRTEIPTNPEEEWRNKDNDENEK